MRDWLPITVYDFFAHLAVGVLFLAVLDYFFGESALAQRDSWPAAQIIFWVAFAYISGHLIAIPASGLLERGIVGHLILSPKQLQLGRSAARRREVAARIAFAANDYRALPEHIRLAIFKRSSAGEIEDGGDAVYQTAFAYARTVPDIAARIDQFRNLYGFSRNTALVAGLATLLFAFQFGCKPSLSTAGLSFASLLVAIGMFGRFLKFYSAYSFDIFRAYATAPKSQASS